MRPAPEIVERVRCIICREAVTCEADGLRCSNGHLMAFRDGYVDALSPAWDRVADDDTVRTAKTFGYEWTTFNAIMPEDASYWEMYFRDVPTEAYAGKVVLDAGCGKGRYTFFTASRAKALAAVDISDAVEAAADNLRELDNVAVIKADLLMLPFADTSFDFISCLGVVHHLRDPEAGFKSLVALLRPGGHFLLYVYSTDPCPTLRSAALAAAARLRRLTVRLRPPVLRVLSAPLALALYCGFVMPGQLGDRLRIGPLAALPLATYRGMPVRSLWLDTFDRLSAPIEHRYTRGEAETWFTNAGLTVLASREEAGMFVFGRLDGPGQPS